MDSSREMPVGEKSSSASAPGHATALHPKLLTPAALFGKPVCRLGLGQHASSALTTEDVFYAIEQGVNFLNWPGLAEGPSHGDVFSKVVASLGTHRESVVICAQFGARSAATAASELRSALATLGTDYIDVLTIYYVERAHEWNEIISPVGALKYLQDARQDGIVRSLGVTSHARKLAGQMAASGLLDVLMVRYNAAHRGAEEEIFPLTQPRGLPVIAYTALRWGALIRPTPDDPPGFSVPRAPSWYRFVLQHPAVAVTLAAPQNRTELDEDLQVLRADGPLADDDYAMLAAHGDRARQHAGRFL